MKTLLTIGIMLLGLNLSYGGKYLTEINNLKKSVTKIQGELETLQKAGKGDEVKSKIERFNKLSAELNILAEREATSVKKKDLDKILEKLTKMKKVVANEEKLMGEIRSKYSEILSTAPQTSAKIANAAILEEAVAQKTLNAKVLDEGIAEGAVFKKSMFKEAGIENTVAELGGKSEALPEGAAAEARLKKLNEIIPEGDENFYVVKNINTKEEILIGPSCKSAKDCAEKLENVEKEALEGKSKSGSGMDNIASAGEKSEAGSQRIVQLNKKAICPCVGCATK